MPGGRGDVESEVEEEEAVCRKAGGRVALRRRLVCEQELGGRGHGGGGGRGECEAVEDGELQKRVRGEQGFGRWDLGGGGAQGGERRVGGVVSR